jgi:YegS/Rv2252/BmrU family lipid kinase
MAALEKILFIINPVSGSGAGKEVQHVLKSILERQKHHTIEPVFKFTEDTGHASSIAKENADGSYDLIVACGGDGTVNEVASALYETEQVMGIFPIGSGNGLARHYRYPRSPKEWLQEIIQGKVIHHDAALINDNLAFNVSGVGFDAHVANLFGKDGKRGFNSYLRLIVSEFNRYKPFRCEVKTESETHLLESFMMPIAVASQFGNNAFIAPDANTNDGMTDLKVIRKMPAIQVIPFAIRVFTKSIQGSSYSTSLKSRHISVQCDTAQPLHIDGEPIGSFHRFDIVSKQSAIKLRVPKNVK